MTGSDIYKLASSFLYERDDEDKDSKEFAVGFINILLQEALPYENSMRRHNEKIELANAQIIQKLEDAIDYDDSITRTALPYGLAAWYFQESMNNFQAENYRAKYIGALNDAKKFTLGSIEDVYGG